MREPYLLTEAGTLHRRQSQRGCGLGERTRRRAAEVSADEAVRWAREGAKLCRSCDSIDRFPGAIAAAAFAHELGQLRPPIDDDPPPWF